MTNTKKLFWIWYQTIDTPAGLAVIEAETPGDAINTLRDVTVTRCQEIPPGSELSYYCRLADPKEHPFAGADLNSCTFCHQPMSAHQTHALEGLEK